MESLNTEQVTLQQEKIIDKQIVYDLLDRNNINYNDVYNYLSDIHGLYKNRQFPIMKKFHKNNKKYTQIIKYIDKKIIMNYIIRLLSNQIKKKIFKICLKKYDTKLTKCIQCTFIELAYATIDIPEGYKYSKSKFRQRLAKIVKYNTIELKNTVKDSCNVIFVNSNKDVCYSYFRVLDIKKLQNFLKGIKKEIANNTDYEQIINTSSADLNSFLNRFLNWEIIKENTFCTPLKEFLNKKTVIEKIIVLIIDLITKYETEKKNKLIINS